MNNYFIILASGQSKRFNSKKPKQFNIYKNKALFKHSLEKAMKSKLFKKIILVVNNKRSIKEKFPKNVSIIKGGKERSDSSLLALKYIKKFKPNNVLIHDGARPNFTISLLKKLINSLKKDKAAVPVVSSKDSIKYKVKKQLYNLKKENSYLTQTPQAFKYKDIYDLSNKQKNKIQDEATLFINNNLKIKFVRGETLNNKITFKEDVQNTETYFGIGFDIHRLIKNKKLYLGGIKIPFHSGLKGHSDGDVILHSIIDALLGAMRKKDIGTFFPDNKKKYKKEYKNLNFYKQYLDLNIEKERKDRARKQVDKSQKIIDSIVQEMKMMEYVLENNKFVKIK